MKKISTITVVIFLITAAIVSCKKPPAVTPGGTSESNTSTTQAATTQPTIPQGTITPGATITGRWRLVSDSTYSSFQTTGPAKVSHHNYVGAADDYYDFEAGGVLSIRRSSFSTDTAGYTLTTGDQVNIVYTPHTCMTSCTMYLNAGEGNFTITTLTANQLVLCSLGFTPEGPLEEILTFQK